MEIFWVQAFYLELLLFRPFLFLSFGSETKIKKPLSKEAALTKLGFSY
jgi:hypothetical protein